jgi:hypothetical protein
MATAARLLFRIVYVPTMAVGRVVAWLAAGYRRATPLERLLILPSWLVLRVAFLVGFTLLLTLDLAARRLTLRSGTPRTAAARRRSRTTAPSR